VEEIEGSTWGCSPTAGVWRGGRNPAGPGAQGVRWLGFKGGGAPAFPWRWEAAEGVQLDVLELLVMAACSGRAPSQRIGGRVRRWRAARRRHRAGRGAGRRRQQGALGYEASLYRGTDTEVPRARTPRRGGGRRPGLPAWHAMALALGSDGLRRAWRLGQSGPGVRRDGSGLWAQPS
jgi:hypothetical protein